VIFLLPEEQAFIGYLKEAKVETEEFEFSSKQLVNIQSQLEKLVSKDYQLHCLAKDAFRFVYCLISITHLPISLIFPMCFPTLCFFPWWPT
jgi:hypothetical protein